MKKEGGKKKEGERVSVLGDARLKYRFIWVGVETMECLKIF